MFWAGAITLLLAIPGPVPAVAGQPEPAVRPARIAVLVDESSSLAEDDVVREREAAALIALGEFAPGSSVSVVGFGSDNGVPGQTPVDVVCPPVTVGTAQDRQRLSDCVGRLKRRTPQEGDGTDHAAALQQALSHLTGTPGDEPRMVFLLTDGKLDVGSSPRYGPDNVNDQRNKAALAQIDTLLAQAVRDRVQVWPLGFGDVDRDQLQRFAEKGYQGSCGPGSPKPGATVVAGSSDVAGALLTAFSSARCAGTGPIRSQELGTGQDTEVGLDIPFIATDGSIIVVKQDPRVVVTYVDPSGAQVPKAGTAGGSTFQVSGENGPVEALRVVNPQPGRWTVRVKSFPGVPPLNVSAAVTWQGAVRAVLSLDPPSPSAGQEVEVGLSLQTRTRPVDDAAALRGLSFTAELTGEGYGGPVPLADATGSGVHTGRVTIPPDARGAFRVTASVAGVGISGDTRTVDGRIVDGASALSAISSVDGTTVAPGGVLDGVIEVTNSSGRTRKVRLQVVDAAPGTLVAVPGELTVFEVPPAGRHAFHFELRFADGTALGANTFTLRAVDDDDPNTRIHERRLTAEVEVPPPWLLIGLVAGGAVAVLVAGLALVAWRRRRDVRGLVVYLLEGGQPRGDLAAPEQPSRAFRFELDAADGLVPKLEHHTGDGGFLLTRVGGALRLRAPTGDVHAFHVGDRLAVGGGRYVEVRDERAAAVEDDLDAGDADRPDDHRHHLL
ncbi:vWA domain-containing protein [Actinosynnema sp. NPDC050436]|uniref:vWA domain-containing protein n=1 Tax=Actinosynnema sp. NPDC050436 TaxID=3155659 RepID=UPI0033C0643D